MKTRELRTWTRQSTTLHSVSCNTGFDLGLIIYRWALKCQDVVASLALHYSSLRYRLSFAQLLRLPISLPRAVNDDECVAVASDAGLGVYCDVGAVRKATGNNKMRSTDGL
jgi:hypothetical protein